MREQRQIPGKVQLAMLKGRSDLRPSTNLPRNTRRSTQRLLRSAPYFPIADVEESARYYERVLGFQRDYAAGTPPQFAIVSRDGLSIMLRLVSVPEKIYPNERQGGTWDAFFWVCDVLALHEELQRNGANIVYGPLIQEAYQMQEFAIRDREGHVLGFGQSLAQKSTLQS
jgi:uncharacterized glyoxalase superfamily protein PhnB